MTPKEKAKELIDKFMDYTQYKFNEHNNLSNVYTAKQCALIAVNEILEDREEIDGMRVINDPYWLEVKKEIENFKTK